MYDDLDWAKFCPGCGKPIARQIDPKGNVTPHTLYAHPPASTEPRLTVEQAWPYLQHKKGCNMLSFTNSMMSHAPISQRLCDCGLDELRSSLTKAAKP